ncbi:MAG: phage tail assembly chaperone family protein, TAC [Rhodospirillaceae bacterium]|nr:phage tail assembly chaperone family protein, TAC [Rhodospirillaceae bacterium]
MKLTVANLRKQGGFTGGPVKRTVEWTHVEFDEETGEEVKRETVSADVWVRPMSYHTAVEDVRVVREGVEALTTHRLMLCVCHDDGSPVFQESDITGYDEEGKPIMVKRGGKLKEQGALNSELSNALMMLVYEVSGLGKARKTTETDSA